MRPFSADQAASYPAVIGCDEVGRGALCGPVVAAAVLFDPRCVPPELLDILDDSKRLTVKQREKVFELVMIASKQVTVAAVSAARIDQDGIRAMTLDAMRRAVLRIGFTAPVRIDGVDLPPGLGGDVTSVVRGETKFPQIAAASVVAKVSRDRLMGRLAIRHPNYAWDANVGYGTIRHIAALRQYGPTGHHRHSFAPVSQCGGNVAP